MVTVFGLDPLRSSRPFRFTLASLAPTSRTRWRVAWVVWRVAWVVLADPMVTTPAAPAGLFLTASLRAANTTNWTTPIVFLPTVTAIGHWHSSYRRWHEHATSNGGNPRAGPKRAAGHLAVQHDRRVGVPEPLGDHMHRHAGE
jgi:hypothetical protein